MDHKRLLWVHTVFELDLSCLSIAIKTQHFLCLMKAALFYHLHRAFIQYIYPAETLHLEIIRTLTEALLCMHKHLNG